MRLSDWKDNFVRRIRKLRTGNRPRVENGSISYIRKPLAKKGGYSLACAILAFLLALVSIGISIAMRGEGGLNIAAFGLSSIIFSVAAFLYGVLSYTEKDKNYTLARIGIATGSLLIIFWVSMIAVGMLV